MPILTKRNVVVTGCSSGIGLCLTKGLANKGYRVIATCRSQKDIDKLATQNIEAILLELSSQESVDQAITEIKRRCDNQIYGLINNAAYGQPGAVIDLQRTVLQQQFETNVFGTQQLTNGLLPLMLAAGQGRIIQISSILGFICLRFRGAYNASKYALEALTDTMRLEHRDSGVFFSLIEPGPIESRFRQNAYEKYKQHIDRENSLFRSAYIKVENRLQQMENARFTLTANAVLKVATHALEARSPKIRYPVTIPTRVMAILKRFLPDRLMDQFLAYNSDRAR